MREDVKDVVVRIERALGPAYRSLGLTMVTEEDAEELAVRFQAGPRVFSPMSLWFGVHVNRDVTLQDVTVAVKCYDRIEVGDNGWIHWWYLQDTSHRVEGTNEEILAGIKEEMMTYSVIDVDYSRPKIIQSTLFALAWEEAVRGSTQVNDIEEVIVERDSVRQTESFVFEDVLGREFRVSYPFDEELPALITIDGRKVLEIRQHDNAEMEQAINALFDPRILPRHSR